MLHGYGSTNKEALQSLDVHVFHKYGIHLRKCKHRGKFYIYKNDDKKYVELYEYSKNNEIYFVANL